MDLATLLVQVDDVLYTWLLIYLLAGSGIYFSIRTRFVQIRRFKDAMNCMMEKKEGDKGVSSFQALMIATASRVGTGNMAGVATAIILGGPGAAFWMWLMAVLGSASAFVESTLAQIYKKKEGDSFKGGPAYYIERALHARWLGIIFAISLIATFAFGFMLSPMTSGATGVPAGRRAFRILPSPMWTTSRIMWRILQPASFPL